MIKNKGTRMSQVIPNEVSWLTSQDSLYYVISTEVSILLQLFRPQKVTPINCTDLLRPTSLRSYDECHHMSLLQHKSLYQ